MNAYDDIQITENSKVYCDGVNDQEKPATGHPAIYLRIPEGESFIVCPYCSKKFVLKKSHDTLSNPS